MSDFPAYYIISNKGCLVLKNMVYNNHFLIIGFSFLTTLLFLMVVPPIIS